MGTTAMTEFGKDSATPTARAALLPDVKFVFGQRMTTLPPIRLNSIMRAGATYGSPGAGPKPPRPVSGTDVSMNCFPSCAAEMTRYTLSSLVTIGNKPFCTVAPWTKSEYGAGPLPPPPHAPPPAPAGGAPDGAALAAVTPSDTTKAKTTAMRT